MAKEPFLDAEKGFSLDELEATSDVIIPSDPLKRVVGQEEAVNLARIAATQRRHLLLAGPPGTGKSMIAQALSLHLPRPTNEIRIVHNPENPERPLVEIKEKPDVVREEREMKGAEGELIDPKEAPINVAERLGYKCVNCGIYSSQSERMCPKCSRPKTTSGQGTGNPFGDLLGGIVEVTIGQLGGRDRVTTTRQRFGKEEVVVFERAGEMIKVLDQKALEKRREIEKISPRKALVRLKRNPFVLATGASETELLGDVKHDPYGGHPQLGTQPYERVVPGSIHEAHQGVLFIDELPQLGPLQRYILTAMQEKRFPISGRNPQSAGASVRVDNVPCNFIFVGACNIQDLQHILSPLRSRISGSGYEILVGTTMPDNDRNRAKLAQFAAQEIVMDKRIPHLSNAGLRAIIAEARKRAREAERKEKSLTLRLRELGGLIRSAGDIAEAESSELIEKSHIGRAIKRARTIEEQIKERYGSFYSGVASETSDSQKSSSPYHFWNYHVHDDKRGYQ
ncbi:MAG: ATP-binding protein [Thermoplasmata archaeon]|nr:ATP-binding protein [Thermoplasmata archaeon]